MSERSILIVEDDSVAAEGLSETLEMLGYRIAGVASTGEEALLSVEEETPHIVLMDIRLRGALDGVETARQIRSRFDVPVVYLTGFADQELLDRAMETEPYGYLVKPIEMKALITTIETTLYKHQVDKRLRESEERYRNLFDNAPVGIFQITVDGRFLNVNPAQAFMLGYESPQDLVRSVKNIAGDVWTEPEKFKKMVEELLARDQVVNVKAEFRRRDGSTLMGNLHSQVVKDADGSLRCVEGFFEDITDRLRAEQEREKERERFETLVDNAPFGMVLIRNDATYEYVNPKFIEMFGYELKDVPEGRQWFRKAYPNPEYRRKVIAYWLGEKSEHKIGEKRSGTFNVTCADGTDKVINFRPVQLRTGGYLMTCEDITERKKAEEALRESEDKYRSVVENMQDVFYRTDRKGNVTMASPSGVQMLGYDTADQVIGLNVARDFYKDPVKRDRLLAILQEKGTVKDFETELVRRDGESVIVATNSHIYYDKSGQPLGVEGILTDISARKRAEQERDKLQAQLLQAQKMEAVGTLAGGIAHDFNNLLTIINGYTELILSEKTEDDPIYSDLQTVLETGRKGAELVQRLMALTRKGENNPQPTDLNRLVENSVALMERTFPKMIEIETILEKDPGIVNADSAQVEQVLMNLCVNAKEAMPEGGRLTIETRNTSIDEAYCRLHPGAKPGPHVLIEISDTGRGMSDETMNRMFDPFFTTKGWDFRKGTGLGLPVAKGIVEQHGGWLTCESEAGVGTTVRVYLPATQDSLSGREPGAAAETGPGARQILLVDDEEHVRDLGKRILERAGHTVITAGDGHEALDIYAREQSDIGLVVIDLMMPQMGGEKCLKELLKINPHVRVIISTGHSMDAQELLRLGALARGFVNKPYEVKQIVQTVRKVLEAGVSTG